MPQRHSVITVRCTPELHRRTVQAARREAAHRETDFSLNRACIEALVEWLAQRELDGPGQIIPIQSQETSEAAGTRPAGGDLQSFSVKPA